LLRDRRSPAARFVRSKAGADLESKISKTTPCKVAWQSLAGAISRKTFDTSGKSTALIYRRTFWKTPLTVPNAGLLGIIAGNNPCSPLKLRPARHSNMDGGSGLSEASPELP
jgi:hypothetical protein